MNVTELRNGTIDLLWNGYSITPERKKKVTFSRPYLRNRQVLVVKKDSGINSFKQMKKYELGMQPVQLPSSGIKTTKCFARKKDRALWHDL